MILHAPILVHCVGIAAHKFCGVFSGLRCQNKLAIELELIAAKHRPLFERPQGQRTDYVYES